MGALAALLAAGVLSCGAAGNQPVTGTGGASAGGGSAGGEGPGGQGPTPTPLQAVEIAVGEAHTCALTLEQSVLCWGDGSAGQLGDGQSGDHHVATPTPVPGLSGVVAIRAGGNSTCAVRAGGAVSCWGDGAYGQLGDGKSGDGYFASSPAPVTSIAGAVDLAVSGTNACAVLGAAGTAWCWGLNDASEEWLGFPSSDCGPYPVVDATGQETLMDEPCEPTPREVPQVAGASAIADGGEHVCARFAGGQIRCWGADDFGQLGDGTSGPDAHDPVPMLVGALSGVVRVALGTAHTCALSGGSLGVMCWGDNSYGQLGIGDLNLDSFRTTPTEVAGLDGALDLDAAAKTTCAVREDGTVQCWGDVSHVLPAASGPTAPSPVLVPGLFGAAVVRTGGGHACALRKDGTVVCWGRNDLGQLGNGMIAPSDFTMMTVPAPEAGPG